MFFRKLLFNISPSLYLRTETTDDLVGYYNMAKICITDSVAESDWVAYLRLVKTRNRIDEELYRRKVKYRG